VSSLFPLPFVLPEGFTYYPAFLSETEESDLLRAIAGIELHPFLFQGFEAKRKVASYGYDYSFDHRRLSKGNEIPTVFHPLAAKVSSLLSVQTEDLAEMLLTEYPPGAVINWHRDAPPFDIVVGISLQTDCIFKMRPHNKELQTRRNIISFPVERRSLYIIEGVARSDWQHSIAPVKDMRYSITFRTLRKPEAF